MEVCPTTLSPCTILTVTTPVLSFALNSPVAASMVPISLLSSASAYCVSAGISTGNPAVSTPLASNLMLEFGVYTSLLGVI